MVFFVMILALMVWFFPLLLAPCLIGSAVLSCVFASHQRQVICVFW